MRILWHSSSPIATSGYGNCTREIVSRLRDAGHEVRIATKHAGMGWYPWCDDKGREYEVCEGTDAALINRMLETEEFDWIVTFWDIWLLQGKAGYTPEKWVAYVPVDTEWISEPLANVCQRPHLTIAMSRHGERELRRAELDPLYAPLGLDTGRFRPRPEGRTETRRDMGVEDSTFLIGAVGLNYGDDRKGFIPLMRAFRDFNARYPDSKLYLHTLANQGSVIPHFVDYVKVAVNLGIHDKVCWAQQDLYQLSRIDEDWLVDNYNALDVFCLPSKGEGFGLPLVDAQACGVPVITTDTTTGTELVGDTGWLIPVSDDDLAWTGSTATWRHEPSPSAILDCLEQAYSVWRRSEYGDIKRAARIKAEEYDWDAVWGQHWVPILKRLESDLDRRKRADKIVDEAVKEAEAANPGKKVGVAKLGVIDA